MTHIRKTEYVDITERVDVYIELDDVLEFISKCTPEERNEIVIHCNSDEVLDINTLYDVQKMEMLNEAFNKYSLEELERVLPNCK